MGGLAWRVVLAVATGYIFVYYSEYAFWARPLDGERFRSAPSPSAAMRIYGAATGETRAAI